MDNNMKEDVLMLKNDVARLKIDMSELRQKNQQQDGAINTMVDALKDVYCLVADLPRQLVEAMLKG